MSYKVIESKYGGRCDACGYDYAAGDYIAWQKDSPCYHEDCYSENGEPPAAKPPPAGGTQAATATERETGEMRTVKTGLATLVRDQTQDRMMLSNALRGIACLRRALGVMAILDVRVAEHLTEYDAAMSTEPKPTQPATDPKEGDDDIPF